MATITNNSDCIFPASSVKLPLELVNKIFYHSLPPHFARRPSRALSPLSLCQVSRRWRTTARSMTDLWERLLLRQDPSQDTLTNAKKFTTASALWFEGRKGRTIDLQFDFDFDTWSYSPFNIQNLRNFVFPIAENVRDFCLEVNSEEQLADWSAAQTTGLNGLEAFSLSITERSTGLYSSFPILQHAPKLHILSLSIFGDPLYNPGYLLFPWMQITHLSLPHQTPFEGWHRVIRLCPRLEHCYVGFEDIGDDMDDDPPSPTDLEAVSLIALQTLTVGFHGTDFSPAVFAMVICPRSKSLSIVSEDLDAGFPRMQQPLDFYLRSASTLQSLRLTRQKITASNVLEVLRVASRLQDLFLDCRGDHDLLLSAMEINQNDGCEDINIDHDTLVPLLQTFTLRIAGPSTPYEDVGGNDPPTFSAYPYVAAVVSRWKQAVFHGGPFAGAELFVDDSHRNVRAQIDNMVAEYKTHGFIIRTNVITGIRGGEVASTRDDAWASWRLEHGLISV
ncbi:hypothetical protein C0991_004814 [Blastosporella zonata]|nr:hypothetical protein C0991_004814 [Blastosporella zonata]